jgi:hypothetical protein
MPAQLTRHFHITHSPSRAAGWNGRLAIVLLLQIGAFWPVWFDYARRLRTGIDEPWGLIALATAIILLIFRPGALNCKDAIENGSTDDPDGRTLLAASLLVVLFVIAHAYFPPLFGAICAISALGLTLSKARLRRRLDLSLMGLLVLSLPLSSALQFYLGYPMRYLTPRPSGIGCG